MNRDEIINLALANMVDIIPLISNIDNEVNVETNAVLISIYERNMAVMDAARCMFGDADPSFQPDNTVGRAS